MNSEIQWASFWENWNYAKELKRMGSPKADAQFKFAQKLRKELNEKQLIGRPKE